MTCKRIFGLGAALLLLGASTAALADHNSPWGAGWANMPNDIHNTRVETLDSGEQNSFRDFVRYGSGATSVNRFSSDSNARRSMHTNRMGRGATSRAQRGGGGRGGRR
jgi:hypothetical protein